MALKTPNQIFCCERFDNAVTLEAWMNNLREEVDIINVTDDNGITSIYYLKNKK